MITVLGIEVGSVFVKKVALLVYITSNLHAPGPGIFSASGCGGFTLPLKEYDILLVFLSGS